MFRPSIKSELKRRLGTMRSRFNTRQQKVARAGGASAASSASARSGASSASAGGRAAAASSGQGGGGSGGGSGAQQKSSGGSGGGLAMGDGGADAASLELTGKIVTSEMVDLLRLENASLEEWAALLEGENARLQRLADLDLDSPGAVDAFEREQDALRGTQKQYQADRQQTAIDIVEFVFRSLNARPPPRSRTDTQLDLPGLVRPKSQPAASSPSSRLSAAAALPSSPRSVASSPPSGPEISQMSLSPVSTSRAPLSQTMTSQSRTRRRTRASSRVGPATFSFSVFKVNKFRRNSPHVLEIDLRTNSLMIKDASGVVKVELTCHNLAGVRSSDKWPKCCELVFFAGVQGGQNQELRKRYRFPSTKIVAEFMELVEDNLLVAGGLAAVPPVGDSNEPNEAGAVPVKVYEPKPLYTGAFAEVPNELVDLMDAVGASLARMWKTNKSKECYEVDLDEKVNPNYRLREQLRMFIGREKNPYQPIGYLMANRLLRDVLFLGWDITRPGGSGREESKSANDGSFAADSEEFEPLIESLAKDSNEIWSSLALKARRKNAPPPAVPPRPQVTAAVRASLGQRPTLDGGALVINDSGDPSGASLAPPAVPPRKPSNAPSSTAASAAAAAATTASTAASSSRGSVSAGSASVASRTSRLGSLVPPGYLKPDGSQYALVLAEFDQIPKNLRLSHVADATEVVKTILDHGFVIVRSAHPRSYSISTRGTVAEE